MSQENISLKRFVLALITVSLLAGGCKSESGSDNRQSAIASDTLAQSGANPSEYPEQVNSMAGIQRAYQQTLRAVETGALDSSSVNYNCRDEKQGTITYYHHGDTLRMIAREYNEYSHTHGIERYFVHDGSPYALYRKNTDWTFKSSNQTIDTVTERRLYVLGNRLTRCEEKEYTLETDNPDNPDPERVQYAAIACPPLNDLMASFKTLRSHQGKSGTINCL